MNAAKLFTETNATTDIDDHGPAALLVSSAVTAGTLLVAFGLLALGVQYFWMTFILGFAVVLPAAMGAIPYISEGQTTGSSTSENSKTPLEELRQRYARGELTDEQFEHRVEQLLETEPTKK